MRVHSSPRPGSTGHEKVPGSGQAHQRHGGHHMPTRTARTAWTGGLQDASGQVELSSSKVGTFDVSFPKRAADDAGGTTSPEELIAGAHSAFFAVQLCHNGAQAGGTPQSLEVTADVTLGPDKDRGGFMLTGIRL